MNYSNMIEEKNLKKVFIVATLVSTLVGTFTASMALSDKIQEKRDKAKQGKVDGAQDKELEQMKKQLARLEKGNEGSADSDGRKGIEDKDRNDGNRSQLVRRSRDDKDDFADSARRSRAMIEDVYQENLLRGGQRYAMGDVVTENKLQAQIIALQQTVIDVLQDALIHGRNLTQLDVRKLIAAQHRARDGSLDALQGQYQRLDSAGRQHAVEDIQPLSSRRQLTFPRSTSPPPRSPPRRARSLPLPPPPDETLFCEYSEHLQRTSRTIGPAFASDGDQCCPGCGVHIAVTLRDVWVFRTHDPPSPPREFQMDARFVVKCHTDDGRFACVLCDRFREMDCLCKSVDALVRHLGNAHTAGEFEKDRDLMEVEIV